MVQGVFSTIKHLQLGHLEPHGKGKHHYLGGERQVCLLNKLLHDRRGFPMQGLHHSIQLGPRVLKLLVYVASCFRLLITLPFQTSLCGLALCWGNNQLRSHVAPKTSRRFNP
jgi:hypothetical protein